MNKKEAYEFLNSHIEKEILFAYSGNKEKFDKAMHILKELVIRDKYSKPKKIEGVEWCYCTTCSSKVCPEIQNFCPVCGKRLRPEIIKL